MNGEHNTRYYTLLQPPTRALQVGASFDCVEGNVRTKEETKEETAKNNSQALLSQKRFFEKFRNSEAKPKASAQPSPQGLLEALSATTSTTVSLCVQLYKIVIS